MSVGVFAGGERDLGSNLRLLERAGVPLVHVDVMDGRFCAGEVGNVDAVACTRTTLRKDVHLMVADPLNHVADYAAAGADLITVHIETHDPSTTLRAISDLPNANDPGRPVLSGLAVLPATPIDAVATLLDLVDVVLVLGVTPGVAGTDPSARARLAAASRLVEQRDVLLAFDGGVAVEDIADLAGLGADLIVTGSAVFRGLLPPAEILAAMQGQLE